MNRGMREILFRGKVTGIPLYLQDKTKIGTWVYGSYVSYPVAQIFDLEDEYIVDPATVGQFTGLCDKNGVTKIFEGDIIRLDGTIGGNIYEEKELLKDTTNLIIKGVGTSSWATTEQEAIMRGCHYAE